MREGEKQENEPETQGMPIWRATIGPWEIRPPASMASAGGGMREREKEERSEARERKELERSWEESVPPALRMTSFHSASANLTTRMSPCLNLS